MVGRRLAADWLIAGAALVTIVLAITLLAAGPIYAEGIAVAGARRKLADAPVGDANVRITQRLHDTDLQRADDLVQRETRGLLSPAGGSLSRSGVSEPYELPGVIVERLAETSAPDDDRDRHILFRFYEGFEAHATLVDGTWPDAGGDVIEAVIPEEAAEALGLQPGDELEAANRLDRDMVVSVRISGIFQVNSAEDPFWYGEQLPADGLAASGSIVTYGPLVIDPQTFISTLMVRLSEIHWRVFPNHPAVTVADLGPLRGAAASLPARLDAENDASTAIQVETRLPALAAEIDRSLLATRSAVIILTVQLAILASYALLLTANLLVESRAVETALLRARGAGARQVLLLSLAEGLLIVGPAVVVAPWLAAASLGLLNHVGPLAGLGLDLAPQVNRMSYVFAALAGLGCLVVLSVPALLAARSVMGARAARGRESDAPVWQRAGADLMLMAVAGLGFFQLRRFGSPLTETVQGRIALDPLLVAAPALGLLAGAVLALRLIPLLGRLAETLTRGRLRLVPTLSSWQIARRPGRYARSALLLMLALGIGLFAVAFNRTWSDSQLDQAAFQVGADVSVRPDRGSSAIPAQFLSSAYMAEEGVADAMPVDVSRTPIESSSGNARVVLLDAARAGGIVTIRDDLSREPLEALMTALVAGRPRLNSIPLPGEPRRLALDLEVNFSNLCDAEAPGGPACQSHPELAASDLVAYDGPLLSRILVKDARNEFWVVDGDAVPPVDGAYRVTFDLFHVPANGEPLAPSYPLELLEMTFRTLAAPGIDPRIPGSRVDEAPRRWLLLDLDAVLASPDEAGDDWSSVLDNPAGVDWQTAAENASPSQQQPPSLDVIGESESGVLRLEIDPGLVHNQHWTNRTGVYPQVPASFRFSIEQDVRATTVTVPTLVNERLFAEFGFEEGDRILALLGGRQRPISISGTVSAFPSVDPSEPAVIVADLPTVNALRYLETGGASIDPANWWIKAGPGASESLAEALERPPYNSNSVLTRDERYRDLSADPVTLGTLGALTLGFVAAAIFASIGFVSSAAVAARERLAEFALLRAIGLSSRQLAAWLLLENGFLIVVSLAGGTALGLLLSWLILPLITVNREAETVVPELIVVMPWMDILGLELAVFAALVVVSAVTTLFLRRIGLGSLLRLGED